MGISELRQLRAQTLKNAGKTSSLGEDLVKTGTITKKDALLAQLAGRHCDASLERILNAEGLASEEDLLTAHAKRLRTLHLTADDLEGSDIVAQDVDPRDMLKHGFVPLADTRGRAVVATAHPDQFREYAAELPIVIAGAPRVVAKRHDIQDRVATAFRPALVEGAQTRVDERESCRRWGDRMQRRLATTIVFLVALCAVTLAFPTAVFTVFADLGGIYIGRDRHHENRCIRCQRHGRGHRATAGDHDQQTAPAESLYSCATVPGNRDFTCACGASFNFDLPQNACWM